MTLADNKKVIRQLALGRRRALRREDVLRLSASLAERLEALPEFARASIIASYVAMSDEVQTQAVIRRAMAAGKKVLVPLTDSRVGSLIFSELKDFESDLEVRGAFRIMEPKTTRLNPVPLSEADIALVPMVAWDETGARIGYGKGYFDKALSEASGVFSVGLGFECQRVQTVPVTERDIRLDAIVTEARMIRFHPFHGPFEQH